MESVTIQAAPAGQEAPVGDASAKPTFLPDKFWKDGKADYEGLAKSYAEIEKVKATPAQTPEEAAKVAEQSALEAKPPEMSEIPGITKSARETATKELTETGALSAETYASLEKAGYNKATVDSYLKGINADQEAGARTVTAMKAITGGDEQYGAMVGWMSATLSPAEIAGYNKAVSSQDAAMIELAVRGMHSKYTKANGSDPQLLGGRTGGTNAGDVYENWDQVRKAMSNADYRTDEAYRKKVAAKLDRSNIN